MSNVVSQHRRGGVFAWALLGNLALLVDASHRMLDAAMRHGASSTWPTAEVVLAVVFAVGFAWGLATHVEDVPPEEIQKRITEMSAKRDAFVRDERSRRAKAGKASLDDAMNATIQKQAEESLNLAF